MYVSSCKYHVNSCWQGKFKVCFFATFWIKKKKFFFHPWLVKSTNAEPWWRRRAESSCKSLRILSSAVSILLVPRHSSPRCWCFGKWERGVFGGGQAVWVEAAALGSDKMNRWCRFSKSRNLYQELTVGTQPEPPCPKSEAVIRHLGEHSTASAWPRVSSEFMWIVKKKGDLQKAGGRRSVQTAEIGCNSA